MGVLRNPKHERLCHEFMIDHNQAQAAIRTGYSAKCPDEVASRIFARPEVRARLDELIAQRSRRVGVTADRVLEELARVAFMKTTDIVDMNNAAVNPDITDDDRAVIASVKIRQGGAWEEREVRMFDELRALELIGKHIGMFRDNVNLTSDAPTIVDDIPKATQPPDGGGTNG